MRIDTKKAIDKNLERKADAMPGMPGQPRRSDIDDPNEELPEPQTLGTTEARAPRTAPDEQRRALDRPRRSTGTGPKE